MVKRRIVEEIYEIRCNICKKVEVEIKDIKKICEELPDWTIQTRSISPTMNDIESVICPSCNENIKNTLCKSDNIYDRIRGGYYRKYPQKFMEDALEYCGVKDHPKAHKMYQIAYDIGHAYGYSEVMHYVNELSILLKD